MTELNETCQSDVHNQKSLAEFKAFLSSLSDPRERVIAESAFFLGTMSRSEPEHVIVLVHGINTEAEWQEALAQQIRDECGLEAYPIGYGNYKPLHFLWPYWSMRRGPIDCVVDQLRTLHADKPGARISVIAHSFGTFIMSKILLQCDDLRFHRIQLCGSVVDARFKWQSVRSKFRQLVNDVGTRDIWPILAKQSTWGYGDSGAFGFKNTVCRDRHFDYAHSDFMTAEHFSKFWKPFVVDGEIVASAWTKDRKPHGAQIAVLRKLPIKFFLWILAIPISLASAIFGLCWALRFI